MFAWVKVLSSPAGGVSKGLSAAHGSAYTPDIHRSRRTSSRQECRFKPAHAGDIFRAARQEANVTLAERLFSGAVVLAAYPVDRIRQFAGKSREQLLLG